MRTGIMAGCPCPIKVMQEVVEKMHMTRDLHHLWADRGFPGLHHDARPPIRMEARVNTVGGAMFGVECKIVDPETGEELPDNVDGEFVARGYNIMKGYYKMPEATAAAIDAEGWLHTGDLARRDDGWQLQDHRPHQGHDHPRRREHLSQGDRGVLSIPIPRCQDVQVIGVPDKQYGEEIMACIILKEGAQRHRGRTAPVRAAADMAKHKCPRYIELR